MTLGSGGTGSAGASIPFLVVEDDRELENNPLALGAEATRRMKRVADAPMALGESGPERDGGRKEPCEGPAVEGFERRAVLGLRERCCFSGFGRDLDLDEAATESASTDCWCRGWWGPRGGPRARLESLDRVFDELDDEERSGSDPRKEAGVS
jgi:hypothetical protein